MCSPTYVSPASEAGGWMRSLTSDAGCAEAAAVSSRPRVPRRIPEFRFVIVKPPRTRASIDSALVQEEETGGLLSRRQRDRVALRDVGRSGERLGKARRNDFRERVGAGGQAAEL